MLEPFDRDIESVLSIGVTKVEMQLTVCHAAAIT